MTVSWITINIAISTFRERSKVITAFANLLYIFLFHKILCTPIYCLASGYSVATNSDAENTFPQDTGGIQDLYIEDCVNALKRFKAFYIGIKRRMTCLSYTQINYIVPRTTWS